MQNNAPASVRIGDILNTRHCYGGRKEDFNVLVLPCHVQTHGRTTFKLLGNGLHYANNASLRMF